MSTNPSWISKLANLVKPHAGMILFIFSILSASVTYVLVQGSTARSLEHHEGRLAVIDKKVGDLADIQKDIATLVERSGNMAVVLDSVRNAQVEQVVRLLTVEGTLTAQNKATERFWLTTWPAMERRLDRLETLTITPKHGGSNP